MSDRIVVDAVIYRTNGPKYDKEDHVKLEVHDMVDYLVLKHVTHGNKLQALPIKLLTEIGREGDRVREEAREVKRQHGYE